MSDPTQFARRPPEGLLEEACATRAIARELIEDARRVVAESQALVEEARQRSRTLRPAGRCTC